MVAHLSGHNIPVVVAVRPTATGPAPTLPLVGRADELRALTQALLAPEARLVTLTGPPGVGKTALAAAVAAACAERFPDGVASVDLATRPTPEPAMAQVAHALSVTHSLADTAANRVAAYLRDRGCLLVLDSCEAVNDLGPAIGDLLRACPRLRVLATSRERLRLGVEATFAVPPLAMPAPTSFGDPEALAQVPSVALLLARAGTTGAGFALDATNAAAVARICLQLEGLPLALEIVAPWLGELEAEDLAARLKGRGLLLDAEAPGRRQTLRSAIGWSHQLLGPEERLVFRRLSVFPADCTLVAADLVTGEPGLDVLAAVTSLVDKSLLRRLTRSDGVEAFTMLDSIREYAAGELERAGEGAAVRDRHRDYFAALAAQGEAAVATADEGRWTEWYHREHASITQALDHSLAAGDLAAGLALASAAAWHWYGRGHLTERGNEVDQVVDAAERAGAAATMASPLAGAMLAAAVIAYARRDHVRAGALLRRALQLSDPVGESQRCAAIHAFQGHLAFGQGRVPTAHQEYTLALSLQRARGNPRGVAWAEYDLGLVEFATGDAVTADRLIGGAHGWFVGAGDAWASAWTGSALGHVALHLGRPDEAGDLLHSALETYSRNGDQPGIVNCLIGLAGVASAGGHHDRALRLLAAAEANRLAVSQPAPGLDARASTVRAAAENALGPVAAGVRAEGARLPLAGAVRLAGEPFPSTAGDSLTLRQTEIARLVARGLTNRQIARELGIAERTVDVHVSNIMARLGVHSRAAVATYVAQDGHRRT